MVSTSQVLDSQLLTDYNVDGSYTPYIGCVNDTGLFQTKHHRGSIMNFTTLDLKFLEDLFNKDLVPPEEECGIFEPLSSQWKYCCKYLPTTCQLPANCLLAN